MKNKILNFNNNKIDASIISMTQIEKIVEKLLQVLDSDLDGDIVEFGCYIGESSKYIMKTLVETNSTKRLYVYDSFDGLPPLSSWEENTGWRAGTLKTSEEVLISNFKTNLYVL